MLRNYFKIALRNLVKNKSQAIINITGLSVGMAVSIIIGLWIYDEFSFNHQFENYDRIGRVMTRWQQSDRANASQPMPMGLELRNNYHDDFKYVILSTQRGGYIISSGDKKFKQEGNYMQPEATEMFTLNMLQGSRSGLHDPNSILLSQTLAGKLFSDADPLNKTVTIDNKSSVKVTGVYKDFPDNSEFKNISFIAPWDLYVASNDWMKGRESNWSNNFLFIYTQFSSDTDPEKLSAKIKNIKFGHVGVEEAAAKPAVFIHPMSKWHLHSAFTYGGLPKTSEQLKLIWFYGILGIFVLMLACINFMNLSTARSEKRAREVGVRKAIGSLRSQLIGQFYGESLLVAFISFLTSILFVYITLPWFNNVAERNITIPWTHVEFWLCGIAFTIFTGLLAGSYPALYLSSFDPVKVLKGTYRIGRFATVPRKVLVVVQFTISLVLVIGTMVVYKEIEFAKSRPVGYSRDGLVMIPMSVPDFSGRFNTISSELKNTGAVIETAQSVSPVTGIWSANSGFDWKGKSPSANPDFGTLSVTSDYGKTVGWQFVSGRDFDKNLSSDTSGFVINEAASKLLGFKKPEGEIIHGNNAWFNNQDFKILGVVKDMVMNSPFEPANPTIFFLRPERDMNWIFARINPGMSAGKALTKIEDVLKNLVPSAPFEYKFADDDYAAKFANETRIGKLAGFFSLLAVLISCLGLFGLASFMAEKRTKEIGVRKVLGASVFSLWQLLSKEFVLLVGIAFIIAVPFSNYFMDQWLKRYSYRINIPWWIFGIAVFGALTITLLTVSYQAVKAALSNPVKSLRTE